MDEHLGTRIGSDEMCSMRVGNTFPAHVYNLNGHTLPIQSSFKYLGITFSDNTSFNIHINKAYLIINILFRCFITNNYIYIYIYIYISYIRSLTESDSSVWKSDSLYFTYSKHIENIQKYFTKRLFSRCNIPKCSYTNRLIFLNIKSPSLRRLVTDMVLTYTILNEFVDVDPNKILDVYSNVEVMEVILPI